MSHQYRGFHYKDKTVSRPSYLCNETSYLERGSLYWDGSLVRFGHWWLDLISQSSSSRHILTTKMVIVIVALGFNLICSYVSRWKYVSHGSDLLWIGTKQATSHYLYQWWSSLLTHIWITWSLFLPCEQNLIDTSNQYQQMLLSCSLRRLD